MIPSIEIMAAFTVIVWDWQQLLTGERLERFYLFSRLKHLLEYIYVYEWTAEVITAFRTLEWQNQKWRQYIPEVLSQLTTVFKEMSQVESCPIHHTVKQLTMTLNASLARAESMFGAWVSQSFRAPIARAQRRAPNVLSGCQGTDSISGGS